MNLRTSDLVLGIALAATTTMAVWKPMPTPTNVRVHDGDTVKVDFPGLPELFGKDMLVRLRGVDTAELHDPNPIVRNYASKTRDYLDTRVRAAKNITLTDLHKDKYFRVNATMLLDGANIETEMQKKGYSKVYHGEKKNPWTVDDVNNMSKLNNQDSP